MTLTGLAAMPAKIILTGVCFYLVPLYIVSIGNTSGDGRTHADGVRGDDGAHRAARRRAFRTRSLRRDRYVSMGLIISGLSGMLLLSPDSFLVLFGVVFLLGLGQALSIAAQSALVAEHCQEEIRIYGARRGVRRLPPARAHGQRAWARWSASLLVILWGYQGAFVAPRRARARLRHRLHDRNAGHRLATLRRPSRNDPHPAIAARSPPRRGRSPPTCRRSRARARTASTPSPSAA